MKKLIPFLFVSVLLFSSCGNKSEDPGYVAGELYSLLNENSFEEAKQYCTPSAAEFIDELSKKAENEGDTEMFQLMDIVKKDNPVEGDTAIVNYKIGDFKGKIELVYYEDGYKAIYGYNLKKLRIIDISALDLYEMFKTNANSAWNTYGGHRLRVTDLIGGVNNREEVLAIPYNSADNTSPVDPSDKNSIFGYVSYKIYHNDQEVKLTGAKTEYPSYEEVFVLSSFTDINAPSEFAEYDFDFSQTTNRTTKIFYPNEFSFQGSWSSSKYDKMRFSNCTIISLDE